MGMGLRRSRGRVAFKGLIVKRSAWTREEIEAHRQWHISRLIELAYPPSIVKELSDARESWLSAIPIKLPYESVPSK